MPRSRSEERTMSRVLPEQVRGGREAADAHTARRKRAAGDDPERGGRGRLQTPPGHACVDAARQPHSGARGASAAFEAEGIVTFFPHRGAIVSDLSLDEIGEVFDARALIESDLLRRAIPNMTAAVFERADEVLAAFDDALANEDVRVSGADELEVPFDPLCAGEPSAYHGDRAEPQLQRGPLPSAAPAIARSDPSRPDRSSADTGSVPRRNPIKPAAISESTSSTPATSSANSWSHTARCGGSKPAPRC